VHSGKTVNVMKHYLSLLLLFLFTSGFCQCKDSEKYQYDNEPQVSGNYIPFIINRMSNDTTCCFVSKIGEYVEFIVDKAKDYIIKRGGAQFYEDAPLQMLYVHYPKNVTIDYQNEDLYNLSNYEVTYELYYSYWNNHSTEYNFSLKFDKEGKMIGSNQFPDISKNETFETFVDLCDALKTVKSTPQFRNRKVDKITLIYRDDTDFFYWVITDTELNQFPKGKHVYTKNSYYVNANNGILEKIKKQTGTIIVSGAVLKSNRK